MAAEEQVFPRLVRVGRDQGVLLEAVHGDGIRQGFQLRTVHPLLYQLREEGYEFPGRMRDQVAAACKVSAPKLARLKVIREYPPHYRGCPWRSAPSAAANPPATVPRHTPSVPEACPSRTAAGTPSPSRLGDPAKTAKGLGCSTDYLLGVTDELGRAEPPPPPFPPPALEPAPTRNEGISALDALHARLRQHGANLRRSDHVKFRQDLDVLVLVGRMGT